jgi:hypothetical protein
VGRVRGWLVYLLLVIAIVREVEEGPIRGGRSTGDGREREGGGRSRKGGESRRRTRATLIGRVQ